MKYLKQFLLIILFSLIGELLHYLIPLQIPASIYGLVLLFVALLTGLVKLSHVRETAKFLIEIMPIMFIPAGVGLMESWGAFQQMLLPIIVLLIVSTVLVMGISGQVTQSIIRLQNKKKEKLRDKKADQ